MSDTLYYCPCCGCPMNTFTWYLDQPDGTTKPCIQVTCEQKNIEGQIDCPFATFTMKPTSANNTQNLTRYKVIHHYNVFTGEKISG